METVTIELDAISAISATSTAPFAKVYVTLAKMEHIRLLMEARSWRSLHQRAVSRLQQLQGSTKRFVSQLREHATWLLAYLQACCDAGNRAPSDIRAFLPWSRRHLSWQR